MNSKIILVAPVVLLSASLGLARTTARPDQAAASGQMAGHVVALPNQLKWEPAPPGLPAGAKVAVLDGDPTKAEPFTMRVQLPANYKVPPHWHPTDENLLILSGALIVGTGDTIDVANAKTLGVGAYTKMPKEMHHYAMTKSATTFQAWGMGPFGITYVNAADDPRGTKTAEK